jgi:hypothetical protein
MNLVTPATSVGRLPEGCGIAITAISLSQKEDCYPVGGGKFGLFKTALQRLSAALGVSWDMQRSGRIDDGSHPHFCHWRSVGTYRAFDGQLQSIGAERVVDMRNGSSQLQGKSDKQVAEMRAHIASHAETKSQLRAIRSTGIKTAYTSDELSRPFVVARVMFTGATKDPELKRMFAEKTADAFLGATAAMYGGEPAPRPHQSSEPRLPPPPVGSVPADDSGEYDLDTGEVREPASSARAQSDRPAQTGRAQGGGFTIPGGKSKGVPLSEASDRDLEYWHGRIGKDLNEGTSRNEARDSALFEALDAEIRKRAGGEPDASEDDEPKQEAMY